MQNYLFPVFSDRAVGVLLDPVQEGSNSNIYAWPVQLTAEAKAEGDDTHLSGAIISGNDRQWATRIT